MKPYFIKWIPGEYELEDTGNNIMDSKTGRVYIIAASRELARTAIGNGDKLAKRFLCSRDIRVTSPKHRAMERLTDGTYEEFQIDDPNDIYPDMIAAGTQFRVIREIPQGTVISINEGDEFDEEQVTKYFPPLYFTEFLPATDNRPAEDSDLFIFKIEGVWTEPCFFDSFSGPSVEAVERVRLYMCSRAIEKFDNLIYTGQPSSKFEKYEKCKASNAAYPCHEDWCKVIGEVSPDAYWVEAGRDFDEKQIMPFIMGDNYYMGVAIKHPETGEWY